MEAVAGYLLLSGNTYIEAIMDHQGRPTELHPLRPDRMKIILGVGAFRWLMNIVFAVNAKPFLAMLSRVIPLFST
jgi:phage portal protein BeeE